MLGYIQPEKSELKIREYEAYRAYYCGVCRSIGARYGQLPRLFLSFDSVLLAMLLSALSERRDAVKMRRCVAHPAAKRGIAEATREIDYAADMLLVMAYFKCVDDIGDERKISAFAGKQILRRAHSRISGRLPEKCDSIRANLSRMGELEAAGCASFDMASEPFAFLMREIFDYGEITDDALNKENESGLSCALRRIGYHLGKWICLMDAFDDIEKDLKYGNYNSLLLNFGYRRGENAEESQPDFRARICERVKLTALLNLSELSENLRLLPLKKHRGVVENIIFLGLLRKTEEIIAQDNKKQCAGSFKCDNIHCAAANQ
ncbi:MAG: DUF5685 family protein [Clostridiales Family XIII bacterium]|jgi:hypothetical protein|nr:DUF5685 family protein [Clostridiales Family XIII bacterium]